MQPTNILEQQMTSVCVSSACERNRTTSLSNQGENQFITMNFKAKCFDLRSFFIF